MGLVLFFGKRRCAALNQQEPIKTQFHQFTEPVGAVRRGANHAEPVDELVVEVLNVRRPALTQPDGLGWMIGAMAARLVGNRQRFDDGTVLGAQLSSR